MREKVNELHLHREDLVRMIDFIDRINPVDAHLRLGAGTIKITHDNSSGIGTLITASCPHEYAPAQWGELSITITDESNW